MTALEIIRDAAGDVKTTDCLTDMGLDSLELLDLQLSIEKHFGIKISDQEFSDLETVGDLVAVTDRLRHATA